MTVFKYSLRRGLVKPTSIIFNMVLPILMMVMSNEESFAMVGGRAFFFLSFLLLFGGFMMAGGIQADKLDGVTVRILAGPITFRSYLIGNFFAGMVPMVVLCAILGGIGFVRFDWTMTFTGLVVLVLTLVSAVSIGMSFVWSCLFKDKEASLSGISVVLTMTALLGGFMMPLQILPTVPYYIGMATPAHWASRAMEQLIAYGEFTNMYWLGILAIGMFTVAFVLYGSKRRLV